jgi:hypothetical protein
VAVGSTRRCRIADASAALVGFMLHGTEIARASITAYYAR